MIAGTLEIQMAANMARLADDMAKSKAVVGDAMKGIEGAVASAKAALGALGVGLSVGYFVSLIKGSIDAMDHLNDLSKTTSIAVETLAGLKVAAKQSGGDLDSIAASVNKLSVEMGKSPEKFRALGVSAKDPLEAFKQLADIFTKLDDPQQRAAVMAAALGKSWAGAAPLLAEGGKKIGEMVDKGSQLSGITTDMAKKADELNDKWVELVGTGGLLNTLVGKMLDPLLRLTNQMLAAREASTGWLDTMGKFFMVGGDQAAAPLEAIAKIDTKLATLRQTAKDFSEMNWFQRMFSADDIAIVNRQIAHLEAQKELLLKLAKDVPIAPGGAMDMGGSGGIFAGSAAAEAARKAAAFLADKEMYAARVAAIKGAAAAFDAEIKTQGTLTDLAFKEAGINNQRTQEELILQQSALEDRKLRNQLEAFKKLKAEADKQGPSGAADSAKNAELIAQTNAAIVANETITQAQIRAQRTITAQQQADQYNAVIGASEQAGAALANSLRSATDQENNAYQNRLINLGVYLAEAQGQISDADQLQAALKIQHEQNLLQIERDKNQAQRGMMIGTWQLGAELLQALAGKSKLAAIAVIAINKGLAIAQVIQATSVAVMRAFSDLGPVAGVPAAASIKTLGAVQIGLITATGLIQASQVGGGGASIGSPANPLNTTTGGGFAQAPTLAPPSQVILNLTVNGHILDTQEFTDTILVPALKDAIDNRDVTIIGANSRQAANLVAG